MFLFLDTLLLFSLSLSLSLTVYITKNKALYINYNTIVHEKFLRATSSTKYYVYIYHSYTFVYILTNNLSKY